MGRRFWRWFGVALLFSGAAVADVALPNPSPASGGHFYRIEFRGDGSSVVREPWAERPGESPILAGEELPKYLQRLQPGDFLEVPSPAPGHFGDEVARQSQERRFLLVHPDGENLLATFTLEQFERYPGRPFDRIATLRFVNRTVYRVMVGPGTITWDCNNGFVPPRSLAPREQRTIRYQIQPQRAQECPRPIPAKLSSVPVQPYWRR